MNQLIQLLLENIYVVVIAAGFLLSLLSKARKSGRSPVRMPSFGGNPGSDSTRHHDRSDEAMEDHSDGMNRPQTWDQVPGENSAMASEYGARHERRPSPFQSGSASSYDGSSSRIKRGAAPASSSTEPKVEEPAFRMPERDELRKAIIMAEVLGPPRSKRPIRR
ncbi:hypothetical protein FHS18_001052 [Paenibacillus phyllosphaerae]|uniref:Uncharacterized protein n=1 Tax=Paenibacillus phyllosphaerae TaxID=274593 RepID=A0A7W5FLA3_9BACL|nr:hypothetical protein [Paenibacillus phyllosphaerae]MBB3109000.1 hypothetical protein [Paenibacillus phyllosphaerae]